MKDETLMPIVAVIVAGAFAMWLIGSALKPKVGSPCETGDSVVVDGVALCCVDNHYALC